MRLSRLGIFLQFSMLVCSLMFALKPSVGAGTPVRKEFSCPIGVSAPFFLTFLEEMKGDLRLLRDGLDLYGNAYALSQARTIFQNQYQRTVTRTKPAWKEWNSPLHEPSLRETMLSFSILKQHAMLAGNELAPILTSLVAPMHEHDDFLTATENFLAQCESIKDKILRQIPAWMDFRNNHPQSIVVFKLEGVILRDDPEQFLTALDFTQPQKGLLAQLELAVRANNYRYPLQPLVEAAQAVEAAGIPILVIDWERRDPRKVLEILKPLHLDNAKVLSTDGTGMFEFIRKIDRNQGWAEISPDGRHEVLAVVGNSPAENLPNFPERTFQIPSAPMLPERLHKAMREIFPRRCSVYD